MGIAACIAAIVWDLAGPIAAVRFLCRGCAATKRRLHRVSAFLSASQRVGPLGP